MTISGKKINFKGYKDFSDFARPWGVKLAGYFVNSSVRASDITLVHFGMGIVACGFIYHQQYWPGVILLQVKNLLDAMDGSLARLQNRPSKVGRFLDSNLDFILNWILFLSIPSLNLWQKIISCGCLIFQCSVYNYYTILFRYSRGGEQTSKIFEDSHTGYAYDNPRLVGILFNIYKIFYLWQDKIIDYLEIKVLKRNRLDPSLKFINSISLHGLGFQYLLLCLFLLINTSYIVFYFGILANCILLGQLAYRKFS